MQVPTDANIPKRITLEIPQPMPRCVELLLIAQMTFEKMDAQERLAAVNWLIDYYGLPVRGAQS